MSSHDQRGERKWDLPGTPEAQFPSRAQAAAPGRQLLG